MATKYLDQENRVTDDGSRKNVNSKKRLRVPLGDKDGNQVLPGLSRSKTALEYPSIPKPISRSRSSLGFIDQEPKQKVPKQQPAKDTQKPTLHYTHNTILNKQLADRSPELYQEDSDSLRKQAVPVRYPSDSLIFNSNTRLDPVAGQPINIDPIKRITPSKKLDKYLADNAEVFEQLVNDENSIGSGPGKQQLSLQQDEFEIAYQAEPVLDLKRFNLEDSFDNRDVTRDSDDLGLNDNDLWELLQ